MKTIVDYLGEALREYQKYKSANYGSLPESFKRLIEEYSTHSGPVLMMMGALSNVPPASIELGTYLKEALGTNASTIANDGIHETLACRVDPSKLDWPELVRKNWDFFEPAFLFLYMGLAAGRMMERDEAEGLKSIARAERQKLNPNAFDSTGSGPVLSRSSIVSPASDSPELPAITAAQAEQFRQEFERELKMQAIDATTAQKEPK